MRLSIAVHPNNPIPSLTLDQVTNIFLGRLSKWSDAGGTEGVIHVHTRPDRSGTDRFFCDSVLGGRAVSASAPRHAENTLVAAAVAQDPTAIGYVPLGASSGTRALPISHREGSEAYPATPDDARSCRYPSALCRFIYLHVSEKQPRTFAAIRNWQTARAFAEMSQTWRAQAIVANCGFVPELAVLDEEGTLMQKASESIQAYVERLIALEGQVASGKTVLRPVLAEGNICPQLLFESGQTTLTTESRNTLERKLPSWLKLYPQFAKKAMVAEGWTDPMPSEAADKELSQGRADEVAALLTQNHGLNITATGMGKSLFPVSDSEENKRVNRRVVLKVAEGK